MSSRCWRISLLSCRIPQTNTLTRVPPRPRPPPPLIYWGDLSVTGKGDLPLATQRRVESILTPPGENRHFLPPPLPNFAPPSSPFNSILGRSHSIAIFAFFFRYFSSTRPNEFFQISGVYGAPTGFRLAVRHPERITAIISQNGNAYEEGLSDGWTPIRAYWQDPSQANRKALRAFLTPETTHWQYTHGIPDQTMVSPDGQNLDNFYLVHRFHETNHMRRIQFC